ncbi:MAG: Ni/Fe-hydrogenase cytochrome b subunit [Gemmatimonadota bacterium]|jgi:Ni/Fe-hydrogenase subunit HybB-like protein
MLDRRLAVLKTVLWGLVGVLAAVTFVRFTQGLGAVTNLSDGTPWGLWIGFDVMSGVALAAGGFVLAATVYIFGLERYHSFARPAVLTAFLGYAAVAVGLLYDLGLPWNIWHPLVHWQHHSVLFEVAMCVMLYLTVLGLEFAPAVLEHPLFSNRFFRTIHKVLKKATIPLVITGIVLSTLHQSSLGSLFLITPYRLHPLWYSHIIYVLFFVSAVALGLMMVVTESLAAAHFLGHKVHVRELGGLGLAASVVLWIYLALRLGDLAIRGDLGLALDGSRQGLLFLFEIGISAVVPATLLLFRRVRSSLKGMAVAAGFTVFGLVFYRLDVSILAFARPAGHGYFPSWEEFAVSAGVVSAFALIFIFFAQHLHVYDDVHGQPRPRRPSYGPGTMDRLMPRSLAAPGRYTAALLLGATAPLLILPVRGQPTVPAPAVAARTVAGVVQDEGAGHARALLLTGSTDRTGPDASGSEGRETSLLLIDGNRNGQGVLFDHAAHVDRLGGDASCGTCHHLDMPLERSSGCAECHRDMYASTSLFDHASHVKALGGNAGCAECHKPGATVKTYETATACMSCHQSQAADSAFVGPPHDRWKPAEGYMEAMHGLCVACHTRTLAAEPGRHPAGLDQCSNCHDADVPLRLEQLEPAPARATPGKAKARATVTAEEAAPGPMPAERPAAGPASVRQAAGGAGEGGR